MKRPWLAPLVPLYAAGVGLRDLRFRNGWKAARRLRWPVVSIGNLSTGGAGKTPLTIALARLLASRGFHVDVLSRGYGRVSREAARVWPDGTAAQSGDEPLLISRDAGVPVYVAPQRYDAGLLAEAELLDGEVDRRPVAHILDDGFQHRQLARDIDILLLNRADWTDILLPAGNLREPIRAMRRAHVIAIPEDDRDLEAEIRHFGWQGTVWWLHRRMSVPAVSGPVVAFCGIARPEQFFAGIETAGSKIAATVAFRDHHEYTERDLQRLSATARRSGAAAFVTTDKDLVRLGNLAAMLDVDAPLKPARLEIKIEDEHRAVDWLIERLARQSPCPAAVRK
jgi:tetraacyldisaccharide 4'-kinase